MRPVTPHPVNPSLGTAHAPSPVAAGLHGSGECGTQAMGLQLIQGGRRRTPW